MTIRVVLADDQTLVRAGIVELLSHAGDIEVVAEAADGDAAIRACRRHRPDVVLMDIRMPEMDGLEATRRIVSDPALDSVKVLVLTTFEIDEYVFEAIRSGASGFLLKNTEPEELRRAVRVVAGGEALLAPSVTRLLMSQFASATETGTDPGALDVLTDREREVMAKVGEGLSNREIADQLYMSPATAKTHVSRAMIKLGLRDRAQMVVMAYETGLVAPGS